jgi:hypothetical protein
MPDTFAERIYLWRETIESELRKRWWGLIVLFLIGLCEHRFNESANRFIDAHIRLGSLRPLLALFAPVATIPAIALAIILFLLGLFFLLAHAYINALRTRLPLSSPKVIPVRWGKTADRRSGLIVRNDGEPAFDINVDEPIQIGKAHLDFWHRTYSGLTMTDGDLLIEACITLSQGSITDGSALRDLMFKADIASLPLIIRYRGLQANVSFVTKFDIIFETWGEGLRIGNVRQERNRL